MAGMPVACYSGAGGAWRDASGQWVPCSKEEIKRRLRDRQVRLLVCTDAAGEGLNLQFAGVLVNYDLPWNPMKVEQRIGRIDRLGQQRPVIRVLSFAYKDTVEQDVFFTVGNRINLFQGIVGRLQPILSRLPRRFEELALLDRDARETARQRFLAELEQQVTDADDGGFDIDATVEGSLDLPTLPEPALTLRDLDRAIQIARAPPPQPHTQALCSINFENDKKRPTRVDNEAKACLDEVALDLQRQSDAKAVVVGSSNAKEKAAQEKKQKLEAKHRHPKPVDDFAAERAVDTKDYLVKEKGIDASRITVATSATDGQKVEDYLVPAGANFWSDVQGTTPVDETTVKPQVRKPLPVRKHAHHAAKKK